MSETAAYTPVRGPRPQWGGRIHVPMILPLARLACRSARALRSLMPSPRFLRLSGWSGWASASWAESMGNMPGTGMTGIAGDADPGGPGPSATKARQLLGGLFFSHSLFRLFLYRAGDLARSHFTCAASRSPVPPLHPAACPENPADTGSIASAMVVDAIASDSGRPIGRRR